MSADAVALRIDRWLCAARAFRTRTLAAEACGGGEITINGTLAKPHKLVRVGDTIAIGGRADRRIWRVLEIAERRGPASVARTLYDDLTPPPPPATAEVVGSPYRERGSGRPTKRERRQLDRFR
jgi:ribosome-associated heat shock protein Hsp15